MVICLLCHFISHASCYSLLRLFLRGERGAGNSLPSFICHETTTIKYRLVVLKWLWHTIRGDELKLKGEYSPLISLQVCFREASVSSEHLEKLRLYAGMQMRLMSIKEQNVPSIHLVCNSFLALRWGHYHNTWEMWCIILFQSVTIRTDYAVFWQVKAPYVNTLHIY